MYVLQIKKLCSPSIILYVIFRYLKIIKNSSHTVGFLFILIWFSLVMQKLFILMRPHLFILSFMSLALGDMSVRMLLHGMSEIFLPMFSSTTFMVLQLIFQSFIHLEFIFVYGVSWWSSFIFLHVEVQISQHHLLKRLGIFALFYAPASFVKY